MTRLIGAWLNVLAIVLPRTAGRIGFNLFCTPLAPPVKDYHRQFFDTSEKSTFECEGNKIQTYRWGHGPRKILFLHGWQSHSFRWIKYIKAFSKEEYSLYALDAPAHGLSGGKYITLPLYAKVVDRFIQQIQPVHAVITHSFGGFAVLYAFYQRPEQPVDRLVLTGIPGEVSDFIDFYQGVLGLSQRALKIVLARFQEEVHHPPEFFSAVKFAAGLTVPGLIIHDKEDTDTPYRYAEEIHEVWKNSELITTTGLGHNLKSPEVIAWVLAFVSENGTQVRLKNQA